MKQVLLIDGSPVYEEFLTEKLTAEKIKVASALSGRDSFIKLLSLLPNLVIIDIQTSFADLFDFLEKKHNDPNAKSIPVILIGPTIERDKLAQLIRFGVIKYFTTPIKFDVFFETIGQVLKEPVYLDPTPCILDVHLNSNIIFVELAVGLNCEKLSLLRYKISELVDANNLVNPKIIVMLTNLELTFVDATNLEQLFDSVVANKSIDRKNIKILALDSIVKELIDGHPQYKGLEVVTNLSSVVGSLIDSSNAADTTDLITDKILASDKNISEGGIEMRFSADLGSSQEKNANSANSSGTANSGTANSGAGSGASPDGIKIAIIDENANTRQLLQNALAKVDAEAHVFANGVDFISSLSKVKYNLLIIDLFLHGVSALAILQILKKKDIAIPTLIHSQPVQQDIIKQAILLGAKAFVQKPQAPEVVAKKAIDVINGKQ